MEQAARDAAETGIGIAERKQSGDFLLPARFVRRGWWIFPPSRHNVAPDRWWVMEDGEKVNLPTSNPVRQGCLKH
jgi:hypothetical protein